MHFAVLPSKTTEFFVSNWLVFRVSFLFFFFVWWNIMITFTSRKKKLVIYLFFLFTHTELWTMVINVYLCIFFEQTIGHSNISTASTNVSRSTESHRQREAWVKYHIDSVAIYLKCDRFHNRQNIKQIQTTTTYNQR